MSFDLGSYVEVKDRVAMFWELYPEGRIDCTPPSVVTVGDRLFIGSHAAVYKHRDHETPDATGSSWEQFPGVTSFTKNSEAENAETSAVGRALGFLNIGINASIATRDEVRNRQADRSSETRDDRRPQGRTYRSAYNELIHHLGGPAFLELASNVWKDSGAADHDPNEAMSEDAWAAVMATATKAEAADTAGPPVAEGAF